MGNYVNQVHHTTIRGKVVSFAWFTFVHAGNMLFLCHEYIYSLIITHLYQHGSDEPEFIY